MKKMELSMTKTEGGNGGILCACTATGADYWYGHFLLPLLPLFFFFFNTGAPYFGDF